MAINWFTFFAQIVNFLIVVVLLWRFLYRPIVSVMEEREAQIAARFQEAEALAAEARAEAEASRMEREKAEEQRELLLREATEAAGQRRTAMIDEARAEVDDLQRSWYAALEAEKQRFLHEVRVRMGETVYRVARDALTDLADADLEQAIVASFLSRLDSRYVEEHAERAVGVDDDAPVVRSSFALRPETQEQIRLALHRAMAIPQPASGGQDDSTITFVETPDLVCGVEAQFSDRRVSWNIRDYLESYLDELESTLAHEMNTQSTPVELADQASSAGEVVQA